MEIDERNETKEFISTLLKESKLDVQYFEIYYAEKIQQEMFEILTDNLETFNKILSVSNEEKNNELLGIKNICGFSYTENCVVFYSQNNKGLDKIFIKPENTLKDYMESIGLSPDLLTLTSRTSIQSEEINSKTEEEKKNIEIYNKGKAYESLSLERFNYCSNLKENLMGLIPLPNIIFYLIPVTQMKAVRDLIKGGNKKIREKLGYKTKYFGYNELDGIYMNDINVERKINNFEYYKIIKIFNINNKKIEEIICDSVIRPYSINFIEIKSSFNKLEKEQQIKQFLEKCFRFILVFKEINLNTLEVPKLYDTNANKKDFPKTFCYDLFFISGNNEQEFYKYLKEIKKQIIEFLEKKNFNFNFQLIFSSKKIDKYDIDAIHASKNMDTNSLLLNYNKLNFYYEDLQKKYEEREKKYEEREKKYEEREKKYEEHLKKYEEERKKEKEEREKKYEEHLKKYEEERQKEKEERQKEKEERQKEKEERQKKHDEERQKKHDEEPPKRYDEERINLKMIIFFIIIIFIVLLIIKK